MNMRPARRPEGILAPRQNRPSLAKDLKIVREAGLSVVSVERFPDGGYRIHTLSEVSLGDDLIEARSRRAARKSKT